MRIGLATVVGALLAMVALVYVVASSLGTATGATVATTQAVSMVDFAFQPDPITITAGTSVQWTNNSSSSQPHTATSDDGTTFDTKTVSPGQTSMMITFTKTGTFGYYCQYHGLPNGTGMAGTIIVVAPTSTPTRTPTQVVPLVTLTPEAYLPDVSNVPPAATPTPAPPSATPTVILTP